MEFKITKDQFDAITEALCSAYITASRYYNETGELKLKEEMDYFESVLTILEKQAPEEWMEGNE